MRKLKIAILDDAIQDLEEIWLNVLPGALLLQNNLRLHHHLPQIVQPKFQVVQCHSEAAFHNIGDVFQT